MINISNRMLLGALDRVCVLLLKILWVASIKNCFKICPHIKFHMVKVLSAMVPLSGLDMHSYTSYKLSGGYTMLHLGMGSQ